MLSNSPSGTSLRSLACDAIRSSGRGSIWVLDNIVGPAPQKLAPIVLTSIEHKATALLLSCPGDPAREFESPFSPQALPLRDDNSDAAESQEPLESEDSEGRNLQTERQELQLPSQKCRGVDAFYLGDPSSEVDKRSRVEALLAAT